MNIKETVKILVTGSAGFIGYHVSLRLLKSGFNVIGVDNMNPYYDVNLKLSRSNELRKFNTYKQHIGDISDTLFVNEVFEMNRPNIVIHLAGQAGVRYSIDHPEEYIKSNVDGFFNVLELCRRIKIDHFVYASSSSVYGSNNKVPFEETDQVDHPVSLYAATKKSNELFADTYSHLYGIPCTGLRFFTVYGPYGRPDMAYFSFIDNFFAGKAITMFNGGDSENDLMRDFTYIDDIVEGVVRITFSPPQGFHPHEVYNIGNNSPVRLSTFVQTLEKCLSTSLGIKVEFNKKFENIKLGDVRITYASTEKLGMAIGFKPKTLLEVGLQSFTDWYVEYYNKRIAS